MKAVPKEYRALNVQDLLFDNKVDADGNPTGGEVHGPGLTVYWQDGPRATDAEGNLEMGNGAFVEDLVYAALQRLEFFQTSKYASPENAAAIQGLKGALDVLNERRQDRQKRGVEGKHEL